MGGSAAILNPDYVKIALRIVFVLAIAGAIIASFLLIPLPSTLPVPVDNIVHAIVYPLHVVEFYIPAFVVIFPICFTLVGFEFSLLVVKFGITLFEWLKGIFS